MSEDEIEMAQEVTDILTILGQRLSSPTRWNGTLELVPNADFQGKKPFACSIQINASLVGQPIRWATLIHEALHTFSAGYVRDDYQAYRGWEEGVVEQLQRLWRSSLLQTLKIDIPDSIFVQREAMHTYNVYISALEEMRFALVAENISAETETFYTQLLATPLRERPGSVLAMGYQNAALPRAPFVRAYSAANALLTRRIL